MFTYLFVLVSFFSLLSPSTVSTSTLSPHSWDVQKGEKRLIQATSHTNNTFTITATSGSVIIVEGDRAHPTSGDGKIPLTATQSVSISPNPVNELYLIGEADKSSGTYEIECR